MKQKITRGRSPRYWLLMASIILTAVWGQLYAQPTCASYGNASPVNITYKVNGVIVPSLNDYVTQNALVEITFTTQPGADTTIFSLVSYTAIDSVFSDSTADQQVVFDSETIVVGPGTHTLSVNVPDCFFQIDFVKGCVITQLGPAGSGNFYSTQGRLIAADNGGLFSCGCNLLADAGVDLELNCTQVQVALNATVSAGGSGLIYAWTTLGGNIVSGAGTLSATVDAGGTYIFTVTDSLGNCSDSDTAVVTVNTPSINVNAGLDQELTCVNLQATLNATVSGAGSLFAWTTIGGNIVSGGATLAATVDAAGTYVLSVTDTISGCSDNDTVIVTVNRPTISVNAGLDQELTCVNLQATLNATVSGAGSLFAWTTIGGNIVSGGATLTATVDAAGTYVLSVTDTISGCSGSDTVLVTVNRPTISMNAGLDQELTCVNLQATLNATVSGAGSLFAWTTIGGNIVSGGAALTATVDAAGTYVLLVTDSVSGCSDSDTVLVTVNTGNVNADAGATLEINCINASVVLNGSTTLSGATYLWATVNGNIVSGGNTLNPTVNAAGTYTITVTNSSNGCQAIDSVVVTVNLTVPGVNLGADIDLCAGASAVLDAGNTGSGFLWSGGDTTQTITVTAGGSFAVTVTGSNGCSASDTIEVNIHPFPVVNILTRDTLIGACADTIVLDANISGTILWSTAEVSAQIRVVTSGTYTVTVTSAFGCSTAASITVTLINKTINQVMLGDTIVHTGCMDLDATTSGAVDYLWCDGKDYPLVRVCETGFYCVTVTNIYGCTSFDTVYVIINEAVNLGPDTTLQGGSIVLDAGTAGNIYLWSTGATTRTITVTTSGTYWARVSDNTGYLGSDTVIVDIVNSVGKHSLASARVTVAPNPSSGHFRLNISMQKASAVKEIRVINYLGAVVHREAVNGSAGYAFERDIDLSLHDAGIYFIQVEGEGLLQSEKIVKLK
jgi:hypothetical protein